MAIPLELDLDALLEDSAPRLKSTSTASVPYQSSDGNIETMAATLPGNPLEGFVKLRDRVHIYTPAEPLSAGSSDPGLIIICSWAFAVPKHISKYLKGYQSLYPHSQILLVQNVINHMLYEPDSWQMSFFAPAARVVKDYINSIGPNSPRILLQTYSNGGSHSAVQLAECYKKTYGGNMPISAFVMDSTPGTPRYWETVSAMQMGMPKSLPAYWIATALCHAMLFSTAVMHYAGAELATHKLWRTLNDPEEAFLKASIPRTYIHSHQDVMILSKDVLAHAEIAKEKLQEKGAASELVTVEEFFDTKHANHMASDPVRYWGIVKSTWEKAQH